MENEKKKSNVLVIISVIILICGALVGGYFLGNKLTDCKCEKEATNCISGATVNIVAIDEDKDVVYTKEEIIEDYDGSKYSYKLPVINLNTSEVLQINKEIENTYKTLTDKFKEAKNDGVSVPAYTFDYKYYENGNIISVITTDAYDGDYISYKVYNIDKTTGTEVGDLSIFKQAGVTKEDYSNKVCDAMGKFFDAKYGTNAEDADIRNTNTTQICNNRLGYIIVDGKLAIVAEIKQVAGAEYNKVIFDLDGKEVKIFDKQ